ncbi:ABC transporter substrate-binding protein [Rubrimonas cliftonensis]|uniref:Putative spermidine/putrescine transport system substrate-binding protein n=1 Tax=Rubrimonas cliftonensis TaxID=89524 RepID=A0A1H4AH04_9RHOB|nr:extracellular solute-binding protein [Rubrimonas cliftonensis]SEA35279.1 putative spermidine/putrescine transport system substrate-binding protein [Rubrimonas cliftonensis]
MSDFRFTRRGLLRTGAAATAVAAIGAPALAQSRSLKVGSYGGYFENSFKQHVYPAFTAATGIEVESVTQPNGPDWLVTMQQAAMAGQVPADVSLYGRETILKASRIGGLLKPLDVSAIPAAGALDPYFVFEDATGVVGVGAMSWFVSMVVNPDEVTAPESWAEFWNSEVYASSLGVARNYSSNFLDVIAATFLGGPEALNSRDGIVAAVEKAAELKPNVALWWSAESQMEQAMKNGDVIGGTYYHDVAGLMAADGFPIASIFPKEGNPQNYGSWCLAEGSEKQAEAQAFMDFSSQPETQALMSRMIGTAPLLDREKTDLTEAEFAAVSGAPAIRPAFEAYLEHETFMKETWEAMLASS